MTSEMAKAGADAAVVITPSYFKAKMNNSALIQHFEAVADASPIPVILYSVPANTTLDLAPEAVAKLSGHPNIIGMKDSGGDITKMGKMVHETKTQEFQLLAGSAGFLLSSLTVGAVGAISALANALPNEVCQLQALYQTGDLEQARDLQHRLIGPNGAVTKVHGVAGLKTAMEWFGFYGGPTRKPLLPLNEAEVTFLRASFQKETFL